MMIILLKTEISVEIATTPEWDQRMRCYGNRDIVTFITYNRTGFIKVNTTPLYISRVLELTGLHSFFIRTRKLWGHYVPL